MKLLLLARVRAGSAARTPSADNIAIGNARP